MEETASLWELRRSAITSAAYRLPDLLELEQRIDAHIDGMSVSNEVAWRSALEEQEWEGGGEMFCLASLAIVLRDKEKLDTALENNCNPDTSKGLVSALGWQKYESIASLLKYLTGSNIPIHQLAGINGYAAHRIPPEPRYIEALFSSSEDDVRSGTIKAVGKLKNQDYIHHLQHALEDSCRRCQENAAWSLSLFKDDKGIDWLRSNIELSELTELLEILIRAQPYSESVAMIRTMIADSNNVRVAIQSIGILGDSRTVDWLIEKMETTEFARIAAESFSCITGVDIETAGLSGNIPDDYKDSLSDDIEDENVDLDPDYDLPWPDTTKLRVWWSNRKGQFKEGRRHLYGSPISTDNCITILKRGHQRSRISAAYELALLQKSNPYLEIRSRARLQVQAITGLSNATG